jgi:hypothetical protein
MAMNCHEFIQKRAKRQKTFHLLSYHNLTNPLDQMNLFLSDFVSELADKQGHDVCTQWPLQNEIK